jgi:hypothetical protein
MPIYSLESGRLKRKMTIDIPLDHLCLLQPAQNGEKRELVIRKTTTQK